MADRICGRPHNFKIMPICWVAYIYMTHIVSKLCRPVTFDLLNVQILGIWHFVMATFHHV